MSTVRRAVTAQAGPKGDKGDQGDTGATGATGAVGGAGAISKHSAAYTILDTDYIVIATANTFTFTLPTAVGLDGKPFLIKNAGDGVITIAADGAETIDGEPDFAITRDQSITVISDDTNWIAT